MGGIHWLPGEPVGLKPRFHGDELSQCEEHGFYSAVIDQLLDVIDQQTFSFMKMVAKQRRSSRFQKSQPASRNL